MDYKQLFWYKQHILTIRDRINDSGNTKINFNDESFSRVIKNQREGTDIFISKYPNDRILSCVIIDFDEIKDENKVKNRVSKVKTESIKSKKKGIKSKKNLEKVKKEVTKVKKFLEKKGLNSVIIQSGKKGYHLYIQIPFTNFDNTINNTYIDSTQNNPFHAQMSPLLSEKYNDLFFKKYVKNLINFDKFNLKSIDMPHFNTGLNGNIRLIGSFHPDTNERCKIIEGEFIDLTVPNSHHFTCLELANRYVLDYIKQEEKELEQNLKKVDGLLKKGFKDPVAENDLRILLPSMFGGQHKQYNKGYVYMTCFNHPDSNPSMMVTKEWFSCSACGIKGNIWYFIKNKKIKVDKEGVIV